MMYMIADARQNTQTILEYFLAALAAKKKEKKGCLFDFTFLAQFNHIPTQLHLFLYPKRQHPPLPPPPPHPKSKIP